MGNTPPHTISDPADALQAAADRVITHILDAEFKDLIQKLIPQHLTLDDCRSHITYQACDLDWRLRPTLSVNPDRWFLRNLHSRLTHTEVQALDPSLRFSP